MKKHIIYVLLFSLMLSITAQAADENTPSGKEILGEILKSLLQGGDKKSKSADGKIYAPDKDAAFSCESYNPFRKDLFPSFILSTATLNMDDPALKPAADDATMYGDPAAAFGVLLRNVHKGDKFVVEISADGLIKPSKTTFTIKQSEVLVGAAPKLKFDFDALAQINQTKPINVEFKVNRNGEQLDDATETYQVHQINDCPYGGQFTLPKKNGKMEAKYVDLDFMFAAYVNENHPWVDGILKEAKKTGIVDSFAGYQGEDEQSVIDQVNAIWIALQGRNITYSSITDTTPVNGINVQHVRLLDESVVATQANCVDGSAMLASVLKKIGIKTFLVLTTNHCYLAFISQEKDKGGQLYGIETTIIGRKSAMLKFNTRLKEAIDVGTANLNDDSDKFQKEGSGYLLVDLDAARKLGIMPLPYIKGKNQSLPE